MAATETEHISPYPGHHVHHLDPESAQRAFDDELHALHDERETLKARRAYYYAAGRIFVATLFVVAGLVKLVRFDATTQAMEASGLRDAAVLLAAGVAIEIVGGLMLAVGYRVRSAAVGLIIYLVAVTLTAHGDLTVDLNRAAWLANFAFIGALMMLLGHGAGPMSVERFKH